MSNKEVADKLASDIASKYGVKTVVIQGVRHSNPMTWAILSRVDPLTLSYIWKQDAGVKDDCINAVKTTIEKLGGLDIIISNAVSYTVNPKRDGKC